MKICKPHQDFRFDLPAVGMETLRTMKDVRASCLAIEAGKTIVFERDAVIKEADRAGITIVAMLELGKKE